MLSFPQHGSGKSESNTTLQEESVIAALSQSESHSRGAATCLSLSPARAGSTSGTISVPSHIVLEQPSTQPGWTQGCAAAPGTLWGRAQGIPTHQGTKPESLSQRRKCQHLGIFSPIPDKNTTATINLTATAPWPQQGQAQEHSPTPASRENWTLHWDEVKESGTKATKGWKKTWFELTRPKQ